MNKKKFFKTSIPYLFWTSLFGFYFCSTNIIRMAWGNWAESCFNLFLFTVFFGAIWWVTRDDGLSDS